MKDKLNFVVFSSLFPQEVIYVHTIILHGFTWSFLGYDVSMRINVIIRYQGWTWQIFYGVLGYETSYQPFSMQGKQKIIVYTPLIEKYLQFWEGFDFLFWFWFLSVGLRDGEVSVITFLLSPVFWNFVLAMIFSALPFLLVKGSDMDTCRSVWFIQKTKHRIHRHIFKGGTLCMIAMINI